MKFWTKLDKKSTFLGILLFIAFAVLAYQFPYSGDDWAWGSSIGLERLDNWFRGYNGRYAGNLLVLLLTRSKLLQVVCLSASLVFLCFAAKLFSKAEGLVTVYASACLLLLVPKEIFVQSLSWTSGYSNYVPPILLVIIYLIMIRDIFEEKQPKYPRTFPWIAYVLGVVGALFMENLTLYSIALAVLLIGYARWRFRRFYATHVVYLAGCLSGALMMFSNSAYFSIANNTDTYRSTALSKGIVSTIGSHCKVIVEQFFINNLPMLLVISALCMTVALLYAKNCTEIRKTYMVYGSLFVNFVSLGVLYSKDVFEHWVLAVGRSYSANLTVLVMTLTAVMYCLAVLVIVLICVEEKKEMFKMLFLLVSVPIVIAPLLVVNPIGPRCFFPPYALLILFCGTLLQYILDKTAAGETVRKGIMVSTASTAMALFVFLMSIYGTIHSYDEKREAYVQKQVEQGYEVITVCKLPYTSYVWFGDPTTEPWGKRFKLFNGVSEETELTFLTYSEFNKWAKEFDAQNSGEN